MGHDQIELRGLVVNTFCGVLPEERTREQPLSFDLDLIVSLDVAGASDDLNDTVDYGAVCDLVAATCKAEQPYLLERLAHRVAEELFSATPVDAVTITVRKLRPPVPHVLATSGIRISRQRADP